MSEIIRPDLIPLIEGLKPYLGNNLGAMADTVLKVVRAVTSEPFKQSVQLVSEAVPKPVTSKANNTIQGFLMNNFSLILFLILVLLFYGDGSW